MSTRNNDAQESGPLPRITPKILLLPFGQKGAFLVAQMLKNSPAMQETQDQSLGQDPLEKSMASPLQYSCLENSVDRGAFQVTVHGVTKIQTTTEQLTHTLDRRSLPSHLSYPPPLLSSHKCYHHMECSVSVAVTHLRNSKGLNKGSEDGERRL